MTRRILLGMSGGVDSSVAALLLQEEGWQVVVTADHGMSPEGFHGGPSDDQRIIPLYVFAPGAVPGDHTERPISQLNLAPLLCRLLEIPPAPGMRQELEIALR